MGLKIDRRDIRVIGGNFKVATIPETQFFALQDSNRDTGEYLPLPMGVTRWNDALYKSSEVLFAEAAGDIFLIAEDAKFGLTLFHYVYANEGDSTYRYSNSLPYRSIKKRKEQIQMSALSSLAQQNSQLRGGGVAAMNLDNQLPYNGGNAGFPGMADGIAAGAADTKTIIKTAQASGYVFGYVMKNAPATTIVLGRSKDKEDRVSYSLRAKQSKPSGLLDVLMAIPSNCIMRNGNMADVESIKAGQVDFKTLPASAMTYFAVDEYGAIGYISAFGGRLPEYRPNVIEGQTTQWTPSEIMNSSDVSFVTIKATENRKRKGKGASSEMFTFHLKSDSERRSLYTPGNIMCLRALEHVAVPQNGCKDESQAYQLNECAFGGWRFRNERRDGKPTGQKALQVAFANVPMQLWRKKYTQVQEVPRGPKIDREDGIGSMFFMVDATETNEHGETIKREQLKYIPWYQTGKNKFPEAVPAIVRREAVPTKDKTGMRMSNKPIYWKDVISGEVKDESGMFTPYRDFATKVIKQGFMTEDQLKSLSGRSSRASRKAADMSQDQLTSLANFLRSDAVRNSIERVQDDAAQRAVLSAR